MTYIIPEGGDTKRYVAHSHLDLETATANEYKSRYTNLHAFIVFHLAI